MYFKKFVLLPRTKLTPIEAQRHLELDTSMTTSMYVVPAVCNHTCHGVQPNGP